MKPRFNYMELSPESSRKLFELAKTVEHGSLGNTLLDLVNIRASQINGCAFCLDMHCKEAKIHGERELRLYHIAIWRESPLFSDRERAALEWTEALTRIGAVGVPDDTYEKVKAQFDYKELSELTFAIGVINLWNRLNVSSLTTPGSADEMLGLTKAGLSEPQKTANA